MLKTVSQAKQARLSCCRQTWLTNAGCKMEAFHDASSKTLGGTLDTHERNKVMVVMGTRPEAIKLASVVLELKKHPKHFETRICVTGQHREMLDQMLQVFGLQPDYDLGVMKAGQSLADVTAACVTGMDRVL